MSKQGRKGRETPAQKVRREAFDIGAGTQKPELDLNERFGGGPDLVWDPGTGVRAVPPRDVKQTRINELVAAEQAKSTSATPPGAGSALSYVLGGMGLLAVGTAVALAVKGKKPPAPGTVASTLGAPTPAPQLPQAPPKPAASAATPKPAAPRPAYQAPVPRPYAPPTPPAPSAPAPTATQPLTTTPQGPAGLALAPKQTTAEAAVQAAHDAADAVALEQTFQNAAAAQNVPKMAPGTAVAPGVTVGPGTSSSKDDPNVYVVSQTETAPSETPSPGIVDSITSSMSEGLSSLLGGGGGGS
jgi:hypothetical protein